MTSVSKVDDVMLLLAVLDYHLHEQNWYHR